MSARDLLPTPLSPRPPPRAPSPRVVIWGVSLGLGWEKFCPIQIGGFVLLLAGTVIYNSIVKVPGFKYEDAPAAAVVDDESADAALLSGEYDALDAEHVVAVKKIRAAT